MSERNNKHLRKELQIASLKKEKEFFVLDATTDLPISRKAPVALLIMLGIVVSAALGILPIAISAPFGALLMILTGCLGWRCHECPECASHPYRGRELGPRGCIAEDWRCGLSGATFCGYGGRHVTNLRDQWTDALNGDPHQTNLLVMTAGEYTFNDFLRIGVPLVLIMWGAFSWLLPIFYGIR